jgi:hypothetical protein
MADRSRPAEKPLPQLLSSHAGHLFHRDQSDQPDRSFPIIGKTADGGTAADSSADAPVPAVVHYHGAGGDRGIPADFVGWLMNGLAIISPDFRMQKGDTGSRTGFSGNVNFGKSGKTQGRL